MSIKVKKYRTLEECVASFFLCSVEELPSMGPWIWEHNGKVTIWGMRRMLRSRRKIGTWGFCANKKVIHMWASKEAKPKSILRLLAHEIGHMQRPFKRDRFLEERKAVAYEDVALTAFEIMEELLGA